MRRICACLGNVFGGRCSCAFTRFHERHAFGRRKRCTNISAPDIGGSPCAWNCLPAASQADGKQLLAPRLCYVPARWLPANWRNYPLVSAEPGSRAMLPGRPPFVKQTVARRPLEKCDSLLAADCPGTCSHGSRPLAGEPATVPFSDGAVAAQLVQLPHCGAPLPTALPSLDRRPHARPSAGRRTLTNFAPVREEACPMATRTAAGQQLLVAMLLCNFLRA